MDMGENVARSVLVRQGVKGIAGVGGGIALLILKGIAAAGFWPGLLAGAVVSIAGLVIGSSREDRAAGMVTAAAGAATVLASIPGLRGGVGWLMWVSGIGLILAGAWSLFKFWRNLRKRGG